MTWSFWSKVAQLFCQIKIYSLRSDCKSVVLKLRTFLITWFLSNLKEHLNQFFSLLLFWWAKCHHNQWKLPQWGMKKNSITTNWFFLIRLMEWNTPWGFTFKPKNSSFEHFYIFSWIDLSLIYSSWLPTVWWWAQLLQEGNVTGISYSLCLGLIPSRFTWSPLTVPPLPLLLHPVALDFYSNPFLHASDRLILSLLSCSSTWQRIRLETLLCLSGHT